MQQKYCICRVNKNKLQYENYQLHKKSRTRTQDQQILLRAVQMGIQPYPFSDTHLDVYKRQARVIAIVENNDTGDKGDTKYEVYGLSLIHL